MNSARSASLCVVLCVAVTNSAPGAEQVEALPPAPAQTLVAMTSSLAPLTLGECVRRALARGFDMTIQRQELAIARDEIPIARGEFHPLLSAGAGKGVVRSPADALGPSLRNESVVTSIGMTQRLWPGTVVSVDTNLNRSDLDPAFVALNPAYASDVTLQVRQPLLKGFGTHINTLSIRRAEIGADVAERSYEDRALEVIEATENAYYLLAGARDQFGVFKTSLQLAQTLLKEAESRHAAGMATKIDVLQAQVGLANARLNMIDAEKTVRSAEDALLSLIGQFELDSPLGPTVLDDAIPSSMPTVESSYARALEYQPALRNARASLELAKLEVDSTRDALKPSLDLDLALGFNGNDTNGGSALSGSFEQDKSSWQVGLSITYPLGRVGEKARFRQSSTALNRQELRIQQLEQDILVRVRSAVRDVETNRESVMIAGLAADLSQSQHDAEMQRFNAGLSISRRVLEAQTDLEAARVARLKAELNLRTARAELARLEGSALDRYGL